MPWGCWRWLLFCTEAWPCSRRSQFRRRPTPPPTLQNTSAPAADAVKPAADSPAGCRGPAQGCSIPRVLVPVDDTQQLVGDKYYVPESLFVELDRLAAGAGGKPRGWLVNRCEYRGTLARNPVSKQLSMSRLRMQCDLQVLQGNTEVALRMRREGGDNPVIAARLDDQPLELSWNAAGDELTIGELAAGQYRLELDLQVRLQTYGTTAGFDLPIIPAANSTLEMSIPADSPMLELPRARGRVRVDKDSARVHADLGATDLLSVRWPLGLGMESTGANVEAEELIWVKVRPGTTQLDVKLKYRVVEGTVRQIRLLADPRLQLIPSSGGNSPVAAVRVLPGDPQRIDVELSRTVSDQVVLELSFLLTGTSGVGNLQFPRLETTGVRTAPVGWRHRSTQRSSPRNFPARTRNRWRLPTSWRPGAPRTLGHRRRIAFRVAKRCGCWPPSRPRRGLAPNKT